MGLKVVLLVGLNKGGIMKGYLFGLGAMIVGSVVFWFVLPQWIDSWDFNSKIILGVVSVGSWWVLLYLGFWVVRGFVDDDDNKAGF